MFQNLLHHWHRTRPPQSGEETEPVPTHPQPVIENDAKREDSPEEQPADKEE